MKKNKTGLVFFILLSISCIKKSNDDIRIKEAKWLYFESNFMKKGLVCNNKNDSINNICFMEKLKIEQIYIKDTLEVVIHTVSEDGQSFCRPQDGLLLNIFGFYPNSDTVTYRLSENISRKRVPENDDEFINYQFMGVYPRMVQRKMFKEFLLSNKSKINSWLKKESLERKLLLD